MGQRLIITEEERKVILEKYENKSFKPSERFLKTTDDQFLSMFKETVQDMEGMTGLTQSSFSNPKRIVEFSLDWNFHEFHKVDKRDPQYLKIVDELTKKFRLQIEDMVGIEYGEEFGHNDILARIASLIPTKKLILKNTFDGLVYDLVYDGMSKEDAKKVLTKYIDYIQQQVDKIYK
jgi:hypothetical protein